MLSFIINAIMLSVFFVAHFLIGFGLSTVLYFFAFYVGLRLGHATVAIYFTVGDGRELARRCLEKYLNDRKSAGDNN